MSIYPSPERTLYGHRRARRRVIGALTGVATAATLVTGCGATNGNDGSSTHERDDRRQGITQTHIECHGLLPGIPVKSGDTFSEIVDTHVRFVGISPSQLPNTIGGIAMHLQNIKTGETYPGASFVIEGKYVDVNLPRPSAGSVMTGLPEQCSREDGGLG